MIKTGRVPRIVVTGSESTGKTTLAGEIASLLRTVWVPEYSRIYAETSGNLLSVATIETIARGQIMAEDAAEQQAHGVLVLDTDLVSTTVYAEHYYGACPRWIMVAARERMGDLYLLADVDLPWEADGIRDQPAARALVQRRFVDRLEEMGARVACVSGIRGERLASAAEAIALATDRIYRRPTRC
ncbi:MAG: ATP-binding protein [Gemmatimonadaceae bacterium]